MNGPDELEMPRRKSNEEFVTDLMNYSRFGGLVQVFVIEAIRSYAEAMATADPAKFDSDLLNGKAWIGVAQEVKAKLDAQYALDVAMPGPAEG